MNEPIETHLNGRMSGIEMSDEQPCGDRLDGILRRAMRNRASDIHLVVGLPPMFRVDGDLVADVIQPLGRNDIREMVYSAITSDQRETFEREWELCISVYVADLGHFRITVYYHHSNIEASIRSCPLSLRSPQELGLPEIVNTLIEKRSGLVLITGATGSGKTTTFNCIIDMINRQRRAKIITVEDPVEFVHENRLSIIVQQQVHSDTRSFSSALMHILRQDPDVIGVGEMRDLETIETALTAAETGHLVIATLHTPDAAQTIDRVVDAFPGDKQNQVLIQLAACLQAVIAQQLVPRVDVDGRVLATEVLVGSPGVRALIRERKTIQLRNTIETSRNSGMHLMDRSLANLYQQGIITYDTAIVHSQSPEWIQEICTPRAAEKRPGR